MSQCLITISGFVPKFNDAEGRSAYVAIPGPGDWSLGKIKFGPPGGKLRGTRETVTMLAETFAARFAMNDWIDCTLRFWLPENHREQVAAMLRHDDTRLVSGGVVEEIRRECREELTRLEWLNPSELAGRITGESVDQLLPALSAEEVDAMEIRVSHLEVFEGKGHAWVESSAELSVEELLAPLDSVPSYRYCPICEATIHDCSGRKSSEIFDRLCSYPLVYLVPDEELDRRKILKFESDHRLAGCSLAKQMVRVQTTGS